VSNFRQLAGAAVAGAFVATALAFRPVVVLGIGAVVAVAVLLYRVLDISGWRIAGAAWTGAAFTAPMNAVRLSSSVALCDVFLVIAVVAMVPSVALTRRASLRQDDAQVVVGLAVIAVGGLLGAIFSARPDISLIDTAKFVLAAGGSVVAVRLWDPDRRSVHWFCACWLAGAVVSALWALTFSAKILGRPLGLATHPNHLAIVCLLGIAMCLGFALGDHPVAPRLCVVALLPLVAALVESGSRAALVGFLVMVPAVAALSRRVQLAVRAAAVVGIVGVAVLAGVVHFPADTGVARLFGGASTPGSNASRVEHLQRSLSRFERHPLTGEGFEFAQEAHNVYLQTLVAAGPLGLIGFVLAAASVLKAGSRRGLGGGRGRATGDRALLAGLTGGYLGYLVAGLFQNILWDRYLWLYVAAILSVAANLAAHPPKAARPRAGVRAS
jgi:O-antigen ligase